ncbi:MAG: hypothetical protein WBA12_04985, partial [Catalinimonas sp.]
MPRAALLRHLFRVWLLCLCSGGAAAQVALLDSAEALLERGEVSRAESVINQAARHDTTAALPRTWYLRAFVYKELLKNTADSATYEARRRAGLTSIDVGTRLDPEGKYADRHRALRDYLLATLYNQGIDAFNAQRYPAALRLFEQLLARREAVTNDTLLSETHYHAAWAALMNLDSAAAQTHFEQALALGYRSSFLYERLASLYHDAPRRAGRLLVEGRSLFPDALN